MTQGAQPERTASDLPHHDNPPETPRTTQDQSQPSEPPTAPPRRPQRSRATKDAERQTCSAEQTGATRNAQGPENPSSDRDRLVDWRSWLQLSTTPATTSTEQAMFELRLDGGRIAELEAWPLSPAPRIYVAYDDAGPVYVGQTCRPLVARIRSHVGNQRTSTQLRKAGTWRFIVAAAFEHLAHGELDQLERSAAMWLLPQQHRAGRRHPADRRPCDVSDPTRDRPPL